jgi:hypothetical protein
MVDKSKQSVVVLDQALKVLEHAMKLADEKDDLDAMIGISDRLMMLYQHLSDKNTKKFKPGFSLIEKDDEVDKNNESD